MMMMMMMTMLMMTMMMMMMMIEKRLHVRQASKEWSNFINDEG